MVNLIDKPSFFLVIALISITIMFTAVQTRTIKLPIQEIMSTKDIKINQKYEMVYPDFKFANVRDRFVSKKVADSNKPFLSCKVTPSEIEFIIQDGVLFEGVPEKPLLIYDFDNIKYSQFLLDFYLQNHDVYVIFQDGTVAYIKLTTEDTIGTTSVYKVSGLQNDEKLEIGYFTKIDNNIIFVNQKYAIKVEAKSATILQGYKQEVKLFQSVTAIEDKYLAATYSNAINIYIMDGANKIKMVQIIPSKEINGYNSSYVDILYYAQQKTLLILDSILGLLSVDVDFGFIVTLSNNTDIIYSRQLCSMMTINKLTQTLHVLCDYAYQFDLDAWPNLKQTNINYLPGIKVQQIFCLGYLTFFIGRDAFAVMYLDKLVNYYEDDNMDRLIITPTIFISANQDSLILGTYQINHPYIQCTIDDQKLKGDHTLIFQTIAECNQKYYQTYNISKDDYGYSQNDVCEYQTLLNVHVYVPGSMVKWPVIVAISVFGLIGLIMIVLMICKKLKLRSTMVQYESFISLSDNHDSQKPMQGDINAETHEQIIEQVKGQEQPKSELDGSKEFQIS